MAALAHVMHAEQEQRAGDDGGHQKPLAVERGPGERCECDERDAHEHGVALVGEDGRHDIGIRSLWRAEPA